MHRPAMWHMLVASRRLLSTEWVAQDTHSQATNRLFQRTCDAALQLWSKKPGVVMHVAASWDKSFGDVKGSRKAAADCGWELVCLSHGLLTQPKALAAKAWPSEELAAEHHLTELSREGRAA